MGSIKTITATTFPAQGEYLGQRCRVCFLYDTFIRVDDGRYVLATECQYAPEMQAADATPAESTP